MAKNKTPEKTPLLNENGHPGYMSISKIDNQTSINHSGASSSESIIVLGNNVEKITNGIENDSLNNSLLDSSSVSTESTIDIGNDWMDSIVDRYDGKTQQRKDINGNWEYKTVIKINDTIFEVISEKYAIINQQKYWTKTTYFTNKKVKFELLSFNENNQLSKIYKNYDNSEKLKEEMSRTTIDLNSFTNFHSSKTIGHKFLEGVIIKAINNIDNFIENAKLFNEELIIFKENPDNSRDLNVLLKFYKYLTIAQNFVDSSKPTVDTSISAKLKTMFVDAKNLTVGLLQIYIGLTGKNLQRVVSNYPIDGKEHTAKDYIDAIFLNWQNYLMVFIDTALGTFLTSTASSWSRDVIFNKNSKTNPFEIKQFINADEFEKYKDSIEALLYEENQQKLMKHFSKITEANDLMQKFNEIENHTQFQYHLNFRKEVETIIENNNGNTDIDEIKKVIASANKTVKSIEKQPTKNPLALANNWGRNALVNLTLEFLTWSTSHVILTGSSENTSKENFNLQEWITKDIFATGALAGNLSRYLFMRPVNNTFKSGLEALGIPTNLCPEEFSKWITKQSRSKKLMMAIPLFLSVTFITNGVKTEAALTTEYGIKKATELFYEKFFRLTTLGFSIGVTMSDMIAFAISDFHKDVFNQSISIKTLANILTISCGFNEQETTLFEDNLTKLEKDGKLPSFDEEFKKYQAEEETIDINVVNNIIVDLKNQPSTLIVTAEIHHLV